MIEKIYSISRGSTREVDKIIQDEHIHYIHIVLNTDEGLPEHHVNSNIYLTVMKGSLSVGLDDQPIHHYPTGTVIKIPYGTKMNIKNTHKHILELILVKAPAPQ